MATPNSHVFVFDSKNAHSQKSTLIGIAVSDNFIVIGDCGLVECIHDAGRPPQPETLTDGRFIYVYRDGDQITINVDPMGQDTVFYYIDPSPTKHETRYWAISNSLYALAQHVSKQRSLAFYRPAINALQINNGRGYGAQLASNNTPVEHMRLLGINEYIYVDLKKSALEIRKKLCGYTGSERESSYRDQLEDFIACAAANVAALVDHDAFANPICDVSGGHDSRFNFGLINALGLTGRVRFQSDAKKTDDLRIANLLRRFYNVEMDNRIVRTAHLEPQLSYDLWLYANAGVYLPSRVSYGYQQGMLRIAGGNFLSKEFGAVPFRKRMRTFARFFDNKTRFKTVEDEFRRAIADLELTPDDPFCMQHHYLNFRGRLHYGRNWYDLFRGQSYTPLLSPKLSRAAFSLPVADYNASKPSMDILAALDNTLAVIPFELEDKFFSSRLLEDSPFWGDPVDFSKIHIPAKRVFGREPEREQADLAESGGAHLANAFRMALKADFDRYLPEVRATNFLEAGYLQGAVEEAETLTGRPEKWRRVAHIVHLGRFMELGVQVS